MVAIESLPPPLSPPPPPPYTTEWLGCRFLWSLQFLPSEQWLLSSGWWRARARHVLMIWFDQFLFAIFFHHGLAKCISCLRTRGLPDSHFISLSMCRNCVFFFHSVARCRPERRTAVRIVRRLKGQLLCKKVRTRAWCRSFFQCADQCVDPCIFDIDWSVDVLVILVLPEWILWQCPAPLEQAVRPCHLWRSPHKCLGLSVRCFLQGKKIVTSVRLCCCCQGVLTLTQNWSLWYPFKKGNLLCILSFKKSEWAL